MNISKQTMSGKCDEKCFYSYQYTTTSTSKAQNFGSFISLTYDKSSVPPVVFNSLHYEVETIELYSPSIHTFTNGVADAEIIIQHSSLQSGSPLLVCIPILSYGVVSSEGTLLLEQIVDAIVSKPLLQYGDPMNVPVTQFTLNSIVPTSAFYYYISPTSNANIIVYDTSNAIFLDAGKIKGLQSLYSLPSSDPYQPSDTLYYNEGGANKVNVTDDNIYIDCSPTGNTREKKEVEFNKKSSQNDLINTFTNPAIVLLLFTVSFVVIIIIYYTVFKFIVGEKIDNSFLNKLQSQIKDTGTETITKNSIYTSVKDTANKLGSDFAKGNIRGLYNGTYGRMIPDSITNIIFGDDKSENPENNKKV